ncbi:hypothetical protein E0W68_08480 [Flavobacterium salilacus subsp. salilacus]|uniref:hypothetical protein n=1 Tax=Flavobacterium TaxID=237 RepID=UPI0010755A85|nr:MULTISPECIES: hypothetical protein [Flavobacterium]KAF2518774.1 hypothetical protein E0W68_08480 [Flavobacterium salilacus subsp. salilacus]MBE1613742.1 hypothetical protein [Flavobacterium sp. SaA2.13]
MTNVLISKLGAFLLPMAFLTSNPGSVVTQKIASPIPLAEKLLNFENQENFNNQDSYTYSAEADFVNTHKEGCLSIQIRVYATNTSTGQRRLIHSALVLSGHGCGELDGRVLLSSTFFGTYSLPDYLVEDQKPDDKPIIPFLKEHPEVYEQYVLKREELQN